MRFFRNEYLSNILHVAVAISFGFTMLAVFAQLFQNAAQRKARARIGWSRGLPIGGTMLPCALPRPLAQARGVPHANWSTGPIRSPLANRSSLSQYKIV